MSDFLSVIVTTRDNPEALDKCLRSLSRQSDRNFEIVVADDGSGINTARVILDWVPRLEVPLKHAWHDKRGAGRGEIRNRALRLSAGIYCLFVDGDCLVPPQFVAGHRALMEPGWFVAGAALALSRRLSERIFVEGFDPGRWGLGRWLAQRWRGDIDGVMPLLRPPLDVARKLRPSQWRGAHGANMAFWGSDLDAIDGFEAAERMEAGEPDVFVRMIRQGVRRKEAGLDTAVFRLWHPGSSALGPAAGRSDVAATAGGAHVRATQGLSQLALDIKQVWPDIDDSRLPT